MFTRMTNREWVVTAACVAAVLVVTYAAVLFSEQVSDAERVGQLIAVGVVAAVLTCAVGLLAAGLLLSGKPAELAAFDQEADAAERLLAAGAGRADYQEQFSRVLAAFARIGNPPERVRRRLDTLKASRPG